MVFTALWNRKWLVLLVLCPGCCEAFPRLPHNSSWFGKKLGLWYKTLLVLPCFLDSLSVPFSLGCFPRLLLMVDPCSQFCRFGCSETWIPGAGDCEEGRDRSAVGNCSSEPQVLYERKAVYWLREICVFCHARSWDSPRWCSLAWSLAPGLYQTGSRIVKGI